MKKSLVLDAHWGYFAEIYADDDNDSGYGANPRVGRFWGSREECEQVDPSTVVLAPLEADSSPDPFDLACERRYDG